MTRSVSVLDGLICSSGTISPAGAWYWRMLRWVSSSSSSIRTPVRLQYLDDGERPERVLLGDCGVGSFRWLIEALHEQPDGLDPAPGPDPQVTGAVHGEFTAWRREHGQPPAARPRS